MPLYSVTGQAGENPRHDLIQHLASPTLMRWGWAVGMPPSAPIPGVSVVRASTAQLDEALAALGDRSGDRADAARAWLTAERDRCAGALAALSELCNERGGFPGIGFNQLFARYAERLAGVDRAKSALARSTTATVRQSREALDHAEAFLREFVQGEVAALVERLAWPAPLASTTFDAARSDTETLHTAARDASKPATLLALALEQGRRATVESALLHVVFERTAPKGVLADAYTMRASMHAETGGSVRAKPASADSLTKPFEEPARWSRGHAAPVAVPYVRAPIDPLSLPEFGV